MPWTRLDIRGRGASGHGLVRTVSDTPSGSYGSPVRRAGIETSARVRRPRLDCEPHATAPDRTQAGALPAAAGLGPAPEHALMRHALITAALDAGVPPRDVQEAASRADPRTTVRDRARTSPDRHATHTVATCIARAAR